MLRDESDLVPSIVSPFGVYELFRVLVVSLESAYRFAAAGSGVHGFNWFYRS